MNSTKEGPLKRHIGMKNEGNLGMHLKVHAREPLTCHLCGFIAYKVGPLFKHMGSKKCQGKFKKVDRDVPPRFIE